MTALRTLWHRFHREEQATTAVEFAVVSMAVCVLLFGAIDWSRFYYNRSRVKHAVRRGALYAARISPDAFDSATVASTTRSALLGTATEQALGVVDVESTGSAGDDARVQVAWIGFPLTRMTSLVIKSARSDTIVAEFRQEQP
jgi:Flp pilus assembly protein TadG